MIGTNPARCRNEKEYDAHGFSDDIPAALPGGVLDLIVAIAVPLSPLAGVPELAPEPFGSIIQPPAQKLLGGGHSPLLQTLFAGFLLFDFIDFLSPPKREKGPQTRPFPVKSACIQLLHKLGGHQFVQPGIFREAVHKGHDGAAALDEAPAGVHIRDITQLVI